MASVELKLPPAGMVTLGKVEGSSQALHANPVTVVLAVPLRGA